MEKTERESMVIDGRLHIQGDDGLFRRIPLGMDDARSKKDHPVYRLEDGKPVKVESRESESDQDVDNFTKAVESIPDGGMSL